MSHFNYYVSLGVVGFFLTGYLTYYQRRPTYKKKLDRQMRLDLQNKIIKWKRTAENPNAYHVFLKENFPENIKIHKERIVWIDTRVMGEWLTLFKKCRSSDRLSKIDLLHYV